MRCAILTIGCLCTFGCSILAARADSLVSAQQVLNYPYAGGGNLEALYQQGSGNTAIANQAVAATNSFIGQVQIGNGNYQSITQTAPNESAIVSQFGSGLSYSITQSGVGQHVIVSQTK